MFYQLLRVQHSCPSTQSWGSVLPSIAEHETRIPGVAPFSYRVGMWNLFVHRVQKSYNIRFHLRIRMDNILLPIGVKIAPWIIPIII